MNSYEERQQARADRYRELAQKAREQSHAAYERSNSLADAIPFGQPILVGHHSERGHRRHIEKIHNAMRQSVDLDEKAEYYERKVKSIESNNSISSDDPEAITKLKAKLAELEKNREETKEYNRQARKEGKETLPGWHFSNLSGRIRSVKQRIAHLEQLAKVKDSEEEVNDVTIKVNSEENRVQVFFPGIPSVETRTKLKRNGFRWSRYNGCWQRMISQWAVQLARDIAQEVSND